MRDDEVLLEFVPHGKHVRVAAIHASSGMEAVIVGPVSAGEAELSRVAIAKLRFILSRAMAADPGPPAPRRPGRWA